MRAFFSVILPTLMAAIFSIFLVACPPEVPDMTDDVEKPAAPTDLEAASGNNEIVLRWNAVAGATSYTIYRQTRTEDWTKIATNVKEATYTDTDAINGTRYFYEVSAVNEAGEGERSDGATEIPRITKPDVPMGFTATSNVSGGVDLSWTAVDGADSYRIYSGTTSDNLVMITIDPLVAGDATSFTDMSLVAETQYFYAIAAFNVAGEGERSAIANATTLSIVPVDLIATASATVAGEVELSWTAVDGAMNYTIYSGITSGRLFPIEMEITATTFTVTSGLSDGTTYFFAIESIFSDTTSARSAVADATTIPGAPEGVSATANATATDEIALAWESTTGADSYTVYRGATADNLIEHIIGETGTTFTDTGLDAGTVYFYAVTATNGTGEGARSEVANAITLPAAPTGLIATASADVAGQIALSWNATTGADSYMIYRGETTGTLTDITPDPAPTNPEFIDTGLNDGTEYFYAVAAVNATGEGTQSDEDSATTLPAAPTGLNVAASATVEGQIALIVGCHNWSG